MRLSKTMGKVAEQERRAARIGNTRKRLDETLRFSHGLPSGWLGRPSGVLRRLTDGTASLFAARLPSGSPQPNDKLQKSSGQTLSEA